jgi:hypothetical protein
MELKNAATALKLMAAGFLLAPSLAMAGSSALNELKATAGDEAAQASAPRTAVTSSEDPAPIACFKAVVAKLGAEDAKLLCQGAISADGTLGCYNAATAALGSPTAMTLCKSASSAEAPIACEKKATSAGLSGDIAAALCAGALPSDDPVGCYEKASKVSSEPGFAFDLCRKGIH